MMTDVMNKPHQLIASDRVEGTSVRRPNGDKIGHIERQMIDKVTGKISYAILSFGGFLGMGTICCRCPGRVFPTTPGSKPTSSTSVLTNSSARHRFAPTRISTGAIAARKPSCIAFTEYRHIGADSEQFQFAPSANLCGTVAGGFSQVDFSKLRRTNMLATHMAAGLVWFRVFGDCRARASADRNHRSRQHGAGRGLGLLVPG